MRKILPPQLFQRSERSHLHFSNVPNVGKVSSKILFIVNPVSGIGLQKGVEKLIANKLNNNMFDFSIEYTKAPKHAAELSCSAAKNNFDIVVAVGGDGSVNEVASGIVGTKTALAILPTGSGNGFARHLKIPANLDEAMDVINACHATMVDTARLNERTFVNIAGVGLDAHIGWKFAQHSRRGFWTYCKVVLREYPKYKIENYSIAIDGKEITRDALLISFANGSQYGNNAYIAPSADVQDGMLEVCILKNGPLYALPGLAYRLFNGTIDRSHRMETFKGKDIVVKQNKCTAHIDGEPIESGSEIHIKVNPLSLKVIVPSLNHKS